jgi:chaperonin GroES
MSEGSIEQFEEGPETVMDTDDGGAIIVVDEHATEEQTKEWFDNIIDQFDEPTLEKLAVRLFEDIERDKKSREKRDEQYEEAIKRTGLGKEAPGGADFTGASKAVHPMLTQACVDYASRAVRELMPPNGPVRTFVPGDRPETERLEKAERKQDYMNWQFKVQMPDFRTELEQLLTQLPLGGSQYLRIVYDHKKKRPVPVFVAVDDVYLPFAASNFYTAERVTYCEYITKYEFEQRVKSGMYRDLENIETASPPDESKSDKATQKIEGRSKDSQYNEDGLRAEYEILTAADLEEELGSAPYRITLDSAARKVVAINRNWEEEDETMESLYWMVEFPFVPWRGAYSIGLGQMIGSLSGAATGALRALLDSAHINNMPTLLRLKGANFSGQSKELSVAEVTEIEGGIASDDIRKLIMPVPFNQPSPVLFQLLGFLVDAGTGVVRTTFDNIADQNPNMPVGTTLALIEEGMKVMSAIHLRTYHAMDYVIRLLHRIDRMYASEDDMMDDIGEILAQRDDFQLPLDVVPTADPEVFSDVQRLAQLQIVSERAMAMPDLYNLRKVEERLLERTKIPNPEELLIPIPEPEEQNAVNENAAMSLQRPVAAFPQQDHLAHLQVHLDFMQNPMLGGLVIIAPTFLPMVLEHIKEHLVLWYVNENYKMLQMITGRDEQQLAVMLEHQDPETRAELDKTLAAMSQKIMPRSTQVLAGIPPIVQQAVQMLQQLTPKPEIPVDPNQQMKIEADAAQKDADRQVKRETAQLRLVELDKKLSSDKELEFAKLSAEERQSAVDKAFEEAQQASEYAARLQELQLKEAGDDQRTAAELDMKHTMNQEDNLTALAIAEAEIESGEKVAVETGTGIDPSA